MCKLLPLSLSVLSGLLFKLKTAADIFTKRAAREKRWGTRCADRSYLPLCSSPLVSLLKLKTATDILQSKRLRSNPIIPDNLAKYRVGLANGVIDIKGSSYPLGSSLTQFFS
jgi:hypothetical protein